MRRATGLTVMELIVAVLIVAILVALLLPVIAASRRKGYETQCVSNMRQVAAALLMYRQDYGDFPPFAQYVFPYTKSRAVFICPLDHAVSFGGVNWFGGGNRYARENSISLSYFYFADPVNTFRRLIRLLPERDPNHGLVACLLHGDCEARCRYSIPPSIESCCQGLTLRVRIDGSLGRSRTYSRPCHDPHDNAPTAVRDRWYYFTDEPCPPEVCTRDCYSALPYEE